VLATGESDRKRFSVAEKRRPTRAASDALIRHQPPLSFFGYGATLFTAKIQTQFRRRPSNSTNRTVNQGGAMKATILGTLLGFFLAILAASLGVGSIDTFVPMLVSAAICGGSIGYIVHSASARADQQRGTRRKAVD
jgi:hypothetical protein